MHLSPVYLALFIGQSILSTYLPLTTSLIPVAVWLVLSSISKARQPKGITTRADEVVPGRTTVQLPDRDGNLASEPADESVVVFQLGSQNNSGATGPNADVEKVAAAYARMLKDLDNRREELGLLGYARYVGDKDNLTTFYFRDAQSIHKFANEPMHREAWQMYDRGNMSHVGLFHETFVVQRKNWEALDLNCRPTMFGATSVQTKEGWVSSLVSADGRGLKSYKDRLSMRKGVVS